MDDLLPYYERELAFLRQQGGEFAAAFPKVAAQLQLSGEACEDPHIERLIESFALLTARISKKLDDEYPQLTEALFDVLYPHYLQPFPSCSIAQFDTAGTAARLSGPATIPRQTELATRSIKGIPCKFRTVYDVTLAPCSLGAASYSTVIKAPHGVSIPAKATGCITLRIDLLREQGGALLDELKRLRFFIDGDPSFAATVRDALFVNVGQVFVQADERPTWRAVTNPLQRVGFSQQEALIPFPAHSHDAYRLMAEYFAFPEKYQFFDLDLSALSDAVGQARSFYLHFILTELRGDSNQARQLDGLNASRLKLGCTPVVNLFSQRAEPIRLQHTSHNYPVIADARRPQAFEIHSIDSVQLVRQAEHQEEVVEFRPFYSLRHGEDPLQLGRYWFAQRNESLAALSPGHELEISLVDLDYDPAAPQTDTLSLQVTCTNRDIPQSLAYGLAGGDLFIEGGSLAREIKLLRKPTLSYRFSRGRGAQWRLISHLALNHLSLARSGLRHLKELLSLYDLPRSPASGRQIEGIVALEAREAIAWLPGKPFASFARGTEIVISIDEASFVGVGVDLFAGMLDAFFALYVHANSFVQLVVKSAQSQEELVRCQPRSGDAILA